MAQQAEGKFKQKVIEDLKLAFGADVDIIATQERARKGVADLIICLKGHSIRNELKVDGSVPTLLQQLKLDRHTRAGGMSLSSTPKTWPKHLADLKLLYGGLS